MATTQRTTAVGLFDDIDAARAAVEALERAGFDEDEIGFLLRDRDLPQGGMTVGETGTKAEEGEFAGAAGGIALGGLLGAAAAILIPGLGAATVGGILAASLVGAAAGAAAGGIVGTLVGMGVPEEEARYYDEQLQTGRSIVAVRAEERYQEALELLRRFGAHTLESGATTNR